MPEKWRFRGSGPRWRAFQADFSGLSGIPKNLAAYTTGGRSVRAPGEPGRCARTTPCKFHFDLPNRIFVLHYPENPLFATGTVNDDLHFAGFPLH